MKNFPPIHYTDRDVALMVRIAAHDSIQRLTELSHTPAADLQLIAAGERRASAGVLAAFELQPNARGYTWQIR